MLLKFLMLVCKPFENRIIKLIAEIFQNREQNYQHVEKCIAEHRMRFCCIAGALERPIVDVQHRNVWQGLYAGRLDVHGM